MLVYILSTSIENNIAFSGIVSFVTFSIKSVVSLTYELCDVARGPKNSSMYSATLYDSEPQSDTIGLPGGILSFWGHLSLVLWIFGNRSNCLFLGVSGGSK